ncbi:hypothetical protein [Streptomyces yanii]|uniref:Uncharacterized protein n=1 Tax=Streptomyces yanii TaxID=78510 RepID=A0ABV5R1Y7_9ACTN
MFEFFAFVGRHGGQAGSHPVNDVFEGGDLGGEGGGDEVGGVHGLGCFAVGS